MNPYHLIELLYIGIIFITNMSLQKKCKRFMRGNMQITNKSISTIKCKAFCGCLMLFTTIIMSIYWINWDATIIFYKPDLNDIHIGFTKEVNENTLHTKRWYEKRSYVEEIFHNACKEYEYTLLTNLNIRILGNRVSDSLCYNCKNDQLYINLQIVPKHTKKRLVCNETYGDHWRIRDDRYHPLTYSYLDKKTLQRNTHYTINYEETCLLYQANDLLKGTWTI